MQTTTSQLQQQWTTTEARAANQPMATASNEVAATTGSEFALPSVGDYASKGTYPWYPTTKVDVRKTTISRQVEQTQPPANAENMEESQEVSSSDTKLQEAAKGNENSKNSNNQGVGYSNGYPYNDMKTYQEYLRNFYAASRNQYQPTKTSTKTGNTLRRYISRPYKK